MKPTWLDATNEKRIATLHPSVQPHTREHVKRCEQVGVYILITEAERGRVRQANLYNKGRTTTGPIVTNAPPGSSFHEYKCAYDAVPVVDGKCRWIKDWMYIIVGEIGQSIGFEWGALQKYGGDFRTIDDWPHFQMRFGLTIKDFKVGKKLPVIHDDQEEFVFSLERLRSLGITKSPDYWLQNAILGRMVKGEYVRFILLNVTKYINLNSNQ